MRHLAALPLGQLSGGERQRAMLARALAQQPRLLVLDEPTSHLDLRYQAETAALLRQVNVERGMTVLLVSHDLDLAGRGVRSPAAARRRPRGPGGAAGGGAAARGPGAGVRLRRRRRRQRRERPPGGASGLAGRTGRKEVGQGGTARNRPRGKGSRSGARARAPKPARSRHCEWGAPSRSRATRGSHCLVVRSAGWEGMGGGDDPRVRRPAPRPRHPPFRDGRSGTDGPDIRGRAAAGGARRRPGRRPGDQAAGTGDRDGYAAGDAGRADGRLGDGHRGRGVRHASLPDGRRRAAQRTRRGDPSLGLARQDDLHQHPRRQSQPGAGARGRRAGQEPHARVRPSWPTSRPT